MCGNWTCTAGWWRCRDNLKCIPDSERCDGMVSCNDVSDEQVSDRCGQVSERCEQVSDRCEQV